MGIKKKKSKDSGFPTFRGQEKKHPAKEIENEQLKRNQESGKYVTHSSFQEEGPFRSKESSPVVSGGRRGHGHRHSPFGRLDGRIVSIFLVKLEVRSLLEDRVGSIGILRSEEKGENNHFGKCGNAWNMKI